MNIVKYIFKTNFNGFFRGYIQTTLDAMFEADLEIKRKTKEMNLKTMKYF